MRTVKRLAERENAHLSSSDSRKQFFDERPIRGFFNTIDPKRPLPRRRCHGFDSC